MHSYVKGILVGIACLLTYGAQKIDAATALSCSNADVSAAITAAAAGSTVNVPAGSCTWSSGITIRKGISLIGAGVGSTVITASGGAILVRYAPSDYSLNAPFRVSGFTFNLGGSGGGVYLGGVPPYTPGPKQTKIRVDHNRFTNGTPGSTSVHAMWIFGAMYGVADNNQFDNIYYPMKADPQLSGVNYGGQWSWNNWSMRFGNAEDNFYFEDNTISFGAIVTDCQFSGRYAFRYNTMTAGENMQPMFDMHGNQGGGVTDANAMWSCFGGELYGNQANVGSYGGRFLNQRGGKALSFYNNISGSAGATFDITEEHADSEEPTTNPEPQHVHSSYYWNNRQNLTGRVISVGITSTINGVPAANTDFFTDETSKGPAGVFCGPASSMPQTCTPGQGYWATNQSCTDLTGMVGAQPATPIAGTLYQCTGSNTWSPFYTPLAYPHPLRGEGGGAAGGGASTKPSPPPTVNVN